MFYLASPYSHPDVEVRHQRFLGAADFTKHCLGMGLHIFSPIVYAHDLAIRFGLPTDAAHWQKFNESMIFRCDGVMVLTLDGWMESVGVQAEIKYAESHNKHIQRVRPI